MIVRPYTPADKDTLDQWWTSHKMPPIPGTSLPQVGFIVEGVGAGFLYKTDSDVAWIENYITNSDTTFADRSEAQDLITAALLAAAGEAGYRRIVACTTVQTVATRALNAGFHGVGAFYVLHKDLNKGDLNGRS